MRKIGQNMKDIYLNISGCHPDRKTNLAFQATFLRRACADSENHG